MYTHAPPSSAPRVGIGGSKMLKSIFGMLAGPGWPAWYHWQLPGHLLVQQDQDPEELPPVDVHPGCL